MPVGGKIIVISLNTAHGTKADFFGWVLLISHAFENCVGHCACVSVRFVLKSRGSKVAHKTQCSNASKISSNVHAVKTFLYIAMHCCTARQFAGFCHLAIKQ